MKKAKNKQKPEKFLRLDSLEAIREFLISPWVLSPEEDEIVLKHFESLLPSHIEDHRAGDGNRNHLAQEKHELFSEYFWRYKLSQAKTAYIKDQVKKLKPDWLYLQYIGYTEAELRSIHYMNDEFYFEFMSRALGHSILEDYTFKMARYSIINAREYFYALDELSYRRRLK
jgi:hypothetical protein